ncbi:DUF1479-domain-containing protein [Exidia glandulosa HHB12029]|uniref:DUF1479-domain-containing protein n=1 Tax=Exidia glandulosa HHB12029 TaxID=1314781 RepID=A0A165QEE9_EXIGL|nr:DUF1479-domain-containing protein [Exidia glandulosa HHB12029]
MNFKKAENTPPVWPDRFTALKKEITAGHEEELTKSWRALVLALKERTKEFIETGPEIVPQVEYAELESLPAEKVAEVKRKGCVVIRNVVPDEEVLKWKADLRKIIEDNPQLEGLPVDDKQFFYLYWSKPQVEARAHANILAATAWLNQLYTGEGADKRVLTAPLTYADRFRIRKPGPKWAFHPPHVDGGSIERWEDPGFRQIYRDILSGEWAKHDAFDIDGRIVAQSDLYDRPNQASVFRTFQGWLAMSDTGPGEGTLRVYPDIKLGNSYIILRPFFSPIDPAGDLFDPDNWKFDVSAPEFPGIILERDGKFHGPRISDATHPNMRTGEAMVSVPLVHPGDMVFWHSDLVHSVEEEHHGNGDSSVMYIPAVPATKQNVTYLAKQRDAFIKGHTPPDFGRDGDESWVLGVGRPEHITTAAARKAMGLEGFEELQLISVV